MKVDVERIDSTQRKLEIVVPIEEVDKGYNEIMQEFRKHSNVKGFRPGKTPVNVIESVYGKQIVNELSAKLVNDTFYKALEDNNLNPVNKPRLNPDELKKGSDFRYSAEFEVIPEFEAEGYVGLDLIKERIEVKDEDINKALDRLRDNASEAIPLEEKRPVKHGDYVFINQEGFVDDKSLEDLKKENLQLIVGDDRLIKEFKDNLIGMQIGNEKEFKFKYDDDFPLAEAQGKEVTFKIKLNDIKERVLPELNDEFAKHYDLESINELKERVKEDLQKQLESQSDGKIRQSIMKTLIDRYSFDIPQSLINQEKQYLLNRYAYDYERRGLKMPDINEEILSSFDKRAQTNVKASIILNKIASKEDIYVTRSEVDNKINEMASMYGIPFDRYKETYEKNNMLSGLESKLIEEKVLDFIIEKANIKEEIVSKNEIDIESEN
jgi:trigger factor